MEKILLDMFDRASPFLSTRENDEHARISYGFALKLLEAEGGDPAVVLPAVILHDVGWKMIPEDLQITAYGPGERDGNLNRVHEKEGARIAGEILTELAYPPHLVAEITEIILEHDSRIPAISLNDAVVKDSDKLWRYSDHGMRVNAERFEMTFEQNLDRLKNNLESWFLTPAGNRMARELVQMNEKKIGAKPTL